MGHQIQALVAHPDVFARLVDHLGPPAPTPLSHDLWIVPLFEPRFDWLSAAGSDGGGSADGRHEGFTYLSARLERGILAAIGPGAALYVETHYFGGHGTQAAALFCGNQLLWAQATTGKPAAGEGPGPTPINRGLAALGVVRAPGQDEFDTVGFVRFRTLDRLGVPERDDD